MVLLKSYILEEFGTMNEERRGKGRGLLAVETILYPIWRNW